MTAGKSAVEEIREALGLAARFASDPVVTGAARRALARLDELGRDLDMAGELGYEAATRDAEARLRALVSIHDVAGQAKLWLLAAADDIQNGGHVGAASRPSLSL